jgi:hypothetical protein
MHMQKPVTYFIETKKFAKMAAKLLGASEVAELKQHLEEFPKNGDVIPSGGGIRKLRWARSGMVKRGGVRIIYYILHADGAIALLTLYAKSQQENLPPDEFSVWVKFVKQLESSMETTSDKKEK